jgi:hypothetical protein
MRTAEATLAARIINEIVNETAQARDQVALVPTWTLTSGEGGAYAPHFNDLAGKKRLMRHADGLHFTEPGYELLAHLTFQRLLQASPRFKAVVSDANATVVR